MSFLFTQLSKYLEAEGVAFAANDVALTEHQREFERLSYDSRDVDASTVFCAVAGERTHGRQFLEAAMAAGAGGVLVEVGPDRDLVTPSVGVPAMSVRDARAALAAAARGHLRDSGARVVAITGSNGKTTTKDFTLAALRSGCRVGASPGNLNSSWGLPAAVLASSPDVEVLVLEMGASAPGEIDALCDIAPPTVGVITNVAPAHLEFFGSEDAVASTKAAVVRRLVEGGTAVLPRDDRYYEFFEGEAGAAEVRSFGRSRQADIRIGEVTLHSSGLCVSIADCQAELPVFSAVNASNAAAAVAVAEVFGIPPVASLDSMQRAELSPHRSRVIVRREGFVLDDSYNANPASMIAALEGLANRPAIGRRLAVLGRMAELGEAAERAHRDVLRTALALDLDGMWVIGEEFSKAAHENADPHIVAARDLQSLVAAVQSAARDDDTWLVKGSRSVGLERVVAALTAEQVTPPSSREAF